MRYLSRKEGARCVWSSGQNIPRIRVACVGFAGMEKNVQLEFKYSQGSEARQAFLDLSIEEAQKFMAELSEALKLEDK